MSYTYTLKIPHFLKINSMTSGNTIIGIDLGGTNIRVGLLKDNVLQEIRTAPTPVHDTAEKVLSTICDLIQSLPTEEVVAIGIGVPSIVDVEKGIVYNTTNIPQWKEVHVKKYIENRFGIPVFVNNDANCFAAGEKHFGKGKNYHSFIGIILGTGLGSGLIIHNQLYEGNNCGAGEIGFFPYKDHNLEYYCSGQFFKDEHHTSGLEMAVKANIGDQHAKNLYRDFGVHVGNMIQTVLYAYDPQLILLGGSVSKSFPLFRESMYATLQHFAFAKTLNSIQIEVSEMDNVAIYGAASLYYDHLNRINSTNN